MSEQSRNDQSNAQERRDSQDVSLTVTVAKWFAGIFAAVLTVVTAAAAIGTWNRMDSMARTVQNNTSIATSAKESAEQANHRIDRTNDRMNVAEKNLAVALYALHINMPQPVQPEDSLFIMPVPLSHSRPRPQFVLSGWKRS